MPHPSVLSEPNDVHSELARLGLTPDVLRKAALAGVAGHAACTELHPAWYAGMSLNAEAVRELRETMKPYGWVPTRAQGLELVVPPDDNFAIAVGSGDSATGDPERTPTSRYGKGSATILAVLENNSGQLSFQFGERTIRSRSEGVRRHTWFLLLYVTEGELRFELSLPKLISRDDYKIVDWHKRIVLPTISRAPSPNAQRAEDEADVDVKVARRVS